MDFEECPICLSEMICEISKLSCGHSFHFDCIAKYQKYTKNLNIICPYCRKEGTIINIYDCILIDGNMFEISSEIDDDQVKISRLEKNCCGCVIV